MFVNQWTRVGSNFRQIIATAVAESGYFLFFFLVLAGFAAAFLLPDFLAALVDRSVDGLTGLVTVF